MTERVGRSYRPGEWYGIVGQRAVVLLPPSEKARVATLWPLVDDGAGFDETLDALISGGLRDLPGFVLISSAAEETKVVLRGAASARFTSCGQVVELDGGAATTWVERVLTDVDHMTVTVAEPGPGRFSIDQGLVRLSELEEGAAVAQEQQGQPRPPAVVAVDPLGPDWVPEDEEYDALTGPAGERTEPGATERSEHHEPPEPYEPEDAREPVAAAERYEPQEPVEPDERDEPDEPDDDVDVDPTPSGPLRLPPPSWRPPMPPPPPTMPPPAAAPWGAPPPPPVRPAPPAHRPASAPMPPPPPPPPWASSPPVREQASPPKDYDADDDDLVTQAMPLGLGDRADAERDEEPEDTGGPEAVARLHISDGTVVDVDDVLVLGRAPDPSRATVDGHVRPVAVPSPHHEISSTHVEVRPGDGLDIGTVVVTDLGSTNGTVLEQPGEGPVELDPGVPVPLRPGAVIDLGDGLTIEVEIP